MDGLAPAFLRDAPVSFGRGAPGILYVEDFDAPTPRERHGVPDIITPSFSHDEVEAAREEGFTYSQFIFGLGEAGIEMDRKVLSDIAGSDPAAFKAIAEKVRAALA